MNKEFIKRVKAVTSKGHKAVVIYNDDGLSVIRADSTRLDNVTEKQIVGTYNAKANESEIIEDTVYHIEQYETAKLEQGKRLDEALGVLHS